MPQCINSIKCPEHAPSINYNNSHLCHIWRIGEEVNMDYPETDYHE